MPEKKNSIESFSEKKKDSASSRYTRGANNPRGRNRGTYKSFKGDKVETHESERNFRESPVDENSNENEKGSEITQNTSQHSNRLKRVSQKFQKN